MSRWTADTLCIIMGYFSFDFQDGGCMPSWNFDTEIFNSHALQRHVLCRHFAAPCTYSVRVNKYPTDDYVMYISAFKHKTSRIF